MVTKQLVRLNPWLIDDHRIKFDYPTKVLVDAGTKIDSKTINHNLIGENADDILIDHNGGEDTIIGGAGDDVLIGTDGYGDDAVQDILNGGANFDTYIVGGGDVIEDSDNEGLIIFKGIDLTGVKTKVKDEESYEDDNFYYIEYEGTLVVHSKTSDEFITIKNWDSSTKEALGITLQEAEDMEVSVDDAVALEAEEMMRITVSLQRELLDDETLTVDLGYNIPILKDELTGRTIYVDAAPGYKYYDSYYGTWAVYQGHEAYSYLETRRVQTGEEFHKVGEVTFESGEQEKVFTYTWQDNDSIGVPSQAYYSLLQGNNTTSKVYYDRSVIPLTAKTNEEASHYSEAITVIAKRDGSATIVDDDEAGRYDPLVLDTNKDGFISTTPLTGSTTYFDITGDGLRERIGWVKGEDALLAYDKNDNGQIDGIDEVFGSANESGFEELKRTIDSNHDNKIDHRDELFAQLQVWNDTNQDASVQAGELQSLSEAGINNIDLNYVSTNININGNLLTEASKYTNTNGTKELAADIQLATDVKDTKVDIEDIPNFTVDPITHLLPKLRGSGLVYDNNHNGVQVISFKTQREVA